nr:hypothetical protein [Candidatus Erwinia dacicola]
MRLKNSFPVKTTLETACSHTDSRLTASSQGWCMMKFMVRRSQKMRFNRLTISFKKGCYTGQEMVARAKFRGANKRALFWLAGKAGVVPAANDALEIQMGMNWRRTGTILAACQLDNGEVWVQAVLNNDLEADTVLRVQGDEGGKLAIQPLPYEITQG